MSLLIEIVSGFPIGGVSKTDLLGLVGEQESLLWEIRALEGRLGVKVPVSEIEGCLDIVGVNGKLIAIFDRLTQQVVKQPIVPSIVLRATETVEAAEQRLMRVIGDTESSTIYEWHMTGAQRGDPRYPEKFLPAPPATRSVDRIFLNEVEELSYFRGVKTQLTNMIGSFSAYPQTPKEAIVVLQKLAEKVDFLITRLCQCTESLKAAVAPARGLGRVLSSHSAVDLAELINDQVLSSQTRSACPSRAKESALAESPLK